MNVEEKFGSRQNVALPKNAQDCGRHIERTDVRKVKKSDFGKLSKI